MRPRIVISALAAVVFAMAMWWQGVKDILIENVVAVPVGNVAMISLTVQNSGSHDRLMDVSSSEAEARIIRSEKQDRPLPIPALHGSSLSMDGAHLALRGLEGELEEGRLIPLTLVFEHAGAIATKARVTRMEMQHGGNGEASICRVQEGEPSPSLAIAVEPEGDGWRVVLDTREFRFAEALVDGTHVPGTGHAHLYVDGVKIGRVYEKVATIPALPPGEHIVRVTLNSNDHRTYLVNDKAVTATVEIVAD